QCVKGRLSAILLLWISSGFTDWIKAVELIYTILEGRRLRKDLIINWHTGAIKKRSAIGPKKSYGVMKRRVDRLIYELVSSSNNVFQAQFDMVPVKEDGRIDHEISAADASCYMGGQNVSGPFIRPGERIPIARRSQ